MGNFFRDFFRFPICSNPKLKRSRQFVTVDSIVTQVSRSAVPIDTLSATQEASGYRH